MNRNTTNYSELVDQYGAEHIPYSVLLETTEWQERRKEIIKRDHNKCTSCGELPTFPHYNGNKWVHIATWTEFHKKDEFMFDENNMPVDIDYKEEIPCSSESDEPTILQVHHRYYIKGRVPWDYRDKAFLTLCAGCHQKLHDTERVKVYEPIEGALIEIDCEPCSRCRGVGYFQKYRKVENGVCFKCKGERYINLIL